MSLLTQSSLYAFGFYAALNALVADYIEQARELDEIPMASSVIRAQLEDSGSDQ